MNTVLALCYLATWAAIPHLLWLKKRPAATLAWLWAILFIPFLGTLVYCLFGTDRLKRRRLKHRARFSAWPSHQRPPASATDEATALSIQNLPGRLAQGSQPPLDRSLHGARNLDLRRGGQRPAFIGKAEMAGREQCTDQLFDH